MPRAELIPRNAAGTAMRDDSTVLTSVQSRVVSLTPPPDGAALLSAEVAFLARPQSYPEPIAGVLPVETHLSWVFLTDAHAYKLKKPVRTAYVDFRSIGARRRNCGAELRLNRRLTSGVYLRAVALRRDASGALTFAGRGDPVDWLVKMRRLPAERMLDRLIAEGRVGPADVDSLVRVFVDFYRRARPCPISPTGYRRAIARGIDEARNALLRPECGMPSESVERVCAALRAVLAQTALFDTRVTAGRIVEGHGDLRPEHVCLQGEPQIIDCLEFSRRLRRLDPLDELGYLALECERLGAPGIGAAILETYRARSDDPAPARLQHAYQAYRALVRAMLAIRHLDDPAVVDRAKWIARARGYVGLAGDHARRFDGGQLPSSTSEPPE